MSDPIVSPHAIMRFVERFDVSGMTGDDDVRAAIIALVKSGHKWGASVRGNWTLLSKHGSEDIVLAMRRSREGLPVVTTVMPLDYAMANVDYLRR